MSIVKSFDVGDGDTYDICHNSDNFSIIDCRIADGDPDGIIDEIVSESADKGVTRFISTHPDDDHVRGLVDLDGALGIRNFYCVKNEATKLDQTDDFDRYCELRDSDKAFYIYRHCARRWMNRSDDERKTAGISVLWPDTGDPDYQEALLNAKGGKSPNNTSCIIRYSVENGVTMLWMGDLETAFMERIEDRIDLPAADVLFAPHHGRDRVPAGWLAQIDPQVVVLGSADSDDLERYSDRNHISQRRAGDITFECESGQTHIYVSSDTYTADFLDDELMPDTHGNYIGTLQTN
jgi:beta-lactamase superfamily II metal-dependent hydrolase